MSREFQAIVYWYPLFAVPAIVGSTIVYLFMRKHITITNYHLLSFLLPWGVWIGLVIFNGTGKSLSNLIEAVLLGAFVVLLLLIQGTASIIKNYKWDHYPQLALALNCLAAALLWAFVPGLQE